MKREDLIELPRQKRFLKILLLKWQNLLLVLEIKPEDKISRGIDKGGILWLYMKNIKDTKKNWDWGESSNIVFLPGAG